MVFEVTSFASSFMLLVMLALAFFTWEAYRLAMD